MHRDTGRHDTGWGHPEHQGRLPGIVRAIERDTPALLDHVEFTEAEHCDESRLLRVHTSRHVHAIRRLAARAAETGEPAGISGDTIVSGASWDAARAAAGCAVDAAIRVAAGTARTAFALCRPPGHHATPSDAMGFCLFNNVAIAVRTLQQEHGVGRILIVDWDVHHGNGTQDAFYEDGTVYYLSLHQHPWYPGTGAVAERGSGSGLDTTRNVPVPAGMSRAAYLETFEAALDETFAEFDPEFVIVSAGYDCLAGDPLGGLLLEPRDIHTMTRMLLDRASDAAAGRVVAVLEGGYAPARAGAGVVATLRAFCGVEPAD